MRFSFLFHLQMFHLLLHSLVNLSFVKYVQKHSLIVFSSASSHLVPSPRGPTGQ